MVYFHAKKYGKAHDKFTFFIFKKINGTNLTNFHHFSSILFIIFNLRGAIFAFETLDTLRLDKKCRIVRYSMTSHDQTLF